MVLNRKIVKRLHRFQHWYQLPFLLPFQHRNQHHYHQKYPLLFQVLNQVLSLLLFHLGDLLQFRHFTLLRYPPLHQVHCQQCPPRLNLQLSLVLNQLFCLPRDRLGLLHRHQVWFLLQLLLRMIVVPDIVEVSLAHVTVTQCV